jgi:folate-binding protein YgfZ
MIDMDQRAYQAAREGSAFYILPGSGILELSGEDRRAFLQRQTSNDIALLSPERALLTVLTSPTARILDVFHLLEAPESIDILPMPGRSEWTMQYLRGRIFFMDKVSLADRSSDWLQLDLLGPGASAVLARLGLPAIPEIERVVQLEIGSYQLKIWALEPTFGAGFRILSPAGAAAELTESLVSSGAMQISEDEFQVLRIEAGNPGPGSELSQEYTPYEAGLSGAVSDDKGCYTGQEILARQATYDKITQSLRGLRLGGPASTGSRLWTGDERPAGVLTSYALSPAFGPIGLAVIRRPHDQEGNVLQVGEKPASGVSGKVVRLPFA